jgi:hypothetical protein
LENQFDIEPERALILLKTAIAIERVMSPFEADESIIFSNANDLPKLEHEIRQQANNEKGAATCFYPNCTANSIKNSHTIQMATSLKETAEVGHLISPQGWKVPDSWISKVGYRNASVFPGFCQLHENIFSEFEKQKDFGDERQFALQLFLTICREISVNENLVVLLSKWLKAYKKFRNSKLEETLYSELAKFGLDKKSGGIKKNSYRFDNGQVIYIKRALKSTREYVGTLHKLKSAAFNDITAGKDEQFYYQVVMTDWEVPVCLAGRGGLRFQFGSVPRTIDLIINVLPYKGKTYLIAGAFRKHKKYVEIYFNRYGDSPFNLLMMVESWMLYGSDHWFLKPSVWDAMDEPIQKKIYDELYHSHKNIMAVPELMIFKQVRLDLIAMYKNLGNSHAIIAGQLEELMITDTISTNIPDQQCPM